jgi:hypothetical protein
VIFILLQGSTQRVGFFNTGVQGFAANAE